MLDNLSAHADAGEIVEWLKGFSKPPRQTFITHGEPAAGGCNAPAHRARAGLALPHARVPRDGDAVLNVDAMPDIQLLRLRRPRHRPVVPTHRRGHRAVGTGARRRRRGGPPRVPRDTEGSEPGLVRPVRFRRGRARRRGPVPADLDDAPRRTRAHAVARHEALVRRIRLQLRHAESDHRDARDRVPDRAGADGLHRPGAAGVGGVERRRHRDHRDVVGSSSTRCATRSARCATSPTSRSASTSRRCSCATRASSTSWSSKGVTFVTTSAGDPTKYTAAAEGRRPHRVPRRADVARRAEGGRRRRRRPRRRGRRGRRVQGTDAARRRWCCCRSSCSKVDVPVIAAGGVCDGRSMAAAFALGAEGVQMGTRMVSAAESPVHDNWKQLDLSAPTESDTVFLNRAQPAGVPRARARRAASALEQQDGPVDPQPRGRARPLLQRQPRRRRSRSAVRSRAASTR